MSFGPAATNLDWRERPETRSADAVEGRSRAASRRVGLVERRRVDDAGDRAAVNDEGGRHRPARIAGDERPRAVDRVDDDQASTRQALEIVDGLFRQPAGFWERRRAGAASKANRRPDRRRSPASRQASIRPVRTSSRLAGNSRAPSPRPPARRRPTCRARRARPIARRRPKAEGPLRRKVRSFALAAQAAARNRDGDEAGPRRVASAQSGFKGGGARQLTASQNDICAMRLATKMTMATPSAGFPARPAALVHIAPTAICVKP